MEPKALLLDEPTSALDPDRKAEVVDVLAALAAAGTTMILVTHEPSVVRRIAHRAIVLDHGLIVREGTPAEVLTER
jgi:polar amino acid transport system ATP-binding protein